MKRLLLTAAAFAALSAPVMAETIGTNQLGGLQPSPGAAINPAGEQFDKYGFRSIGFTLPEGSQPNKSCTGFCTVTYEGEVISQVAPYNYAQVKVDNIFATNYWTISFFRGASYIGTRIGNYHVSIPEGYFLIGASKTPNTPIEIDYTVVGNPYTVVPSGDATLDRYTQIEDVTITFDNCVEIKTNVENGVECFNQYQTNLDEEAEDYIKYYPTYIIKGNSVTLHLPKVITDFGTWKFEALEGVWTLIDANGNERKSPELNLFYVIPNYTYGIPEPTPAAGPVEAFPGIIELTLPEKDGQKQLVNVVNSMVGNYLYQVNEDGTLGTQVARYQGYMPSSKGTESCKLQLIGGSNMTLIPAPGKYRLVIGQKLFNVQGNVNYTGEFSYDYTVEPSNLVNYAITVNDDSTAEVALEAGRTYSEVSEIRATFPAGTALQIVETGDFSWLSNGTANFQMFPTLNPENELEVIYRPFTPVTLPGNYTFASAGGNSAKPGALIAKVNEDGAEKIYSVVVTTDVKIGNATAVEKVEAAMPEIFDIYTIEGICVARAANAETLSTLPAGLYIAGGKKVMVK